ncbi:MAG: ATP-binding protein [Deltaproteobacteria bacterium]
MRCETVEMKAFLTSSLKEMMAIARASKASLFLYHPAQDELELAAFFAPSHIPVEACRRRPGEGVAAKVFQGKVPVLVTDIRADPRFSPNGYGHYRTPSFISIPLMGPRERPLGVISFSDKKDDGTFTAQDLEFVSTVAVYACIIAANMTVAQNLMREKESLDEKKELLEKYASVGKLAAGVVHEINNPLDGIIRFTNMLLNRQEAESLPKDYLLEIKSGLSKIENVTRSLLQFSHHVAPKNMLIRNYVDLEKALDEALIACEARLRADITVSRQIEVRTRLLDMGLSQVFVNVIQNAFDAMPSGGVLDIRAQETDGGVRIIFTDTGPGIASEYRERIFDPFYTDKNTYQRPGLGLSKCREIVERYNGVIKAEGEPGKGGIFTVVLPSRFLEGHE